MEHKICNVRDILEIFLNFLVIICLETALDASFGGLATPLWILCLPLFLPLLFFAVRKTVHWLPAFLAIHPAAVCLLFCIASFLPSPVLWMSAFMAEGIIYAFHSIKLRVTRDDDGEGAIAPLLSGALAAGSFFICAYMKQNAGCNRILWISFLYLAVYSILRYMDNFISYVKINRSSTGAMPEERIFHTGMAAAGGYGAFSVMLLILFAGTPVISWLSEMIRRAGYMLARGIFFLLSLWADSPEGEAMPAEKNPVIDMQAGAADAVPIWLKILDKILTYAVTLAILAGVLFVIVLFVRFLIKGFYSRRKEKRALENSGYTDEEERIYDKSERKEKRLPLLGGSAAEKIRRIYRRTAAEALVRLQSEPGISRPDTMTARELADCFAGSQNAETAESWRYLTELYEQARYTGRSLTGVQVRLAGKLSRQILHTIK